MLELLRRNGTEVANTSSIDMEEVIAHSPHASSNGHGNDKLQGKMNGHAKDETGSHSGIFVQDQKILLRDGSVRGWIAVNVGEEDQSEVGEGINKQTKPDANPIQAVLDGEM